MLLVEADIICYGHLPKDCRVSPAKYGRKTIKEFLIRWKGYGPEFDEWYGEDLLENAKELVQEYEQATKDNPEDTTSQEEAGKCGRGRPRKSDMMPQNETQPQDQTQKRGRGRPRKSD